MTVLFRAVLPVLFGAGAIISTFVPYGPLLVPLFGAFVLVDAVLAAIAAVSLRRTAVDPYLPPDMSQPPASLAQWSIAAEAAIGFAAGVTALAWPDFYTVGSLLVPAVWLLLMGLLKVASGVGQLNSAADQPRHYDLAYLLAQRRTDRVRAYYQSSSGFVSLALGLALLVGIRTGAAGLDETTVWVIGIGAAALGIVPILSGIFINWRLTYRPEADDFIPPPEPADRPAVPAEPPSGPEIVPVVPEGLTVACASGDCVLYVGGGLSVLGGFPTWRAFVERLLTWANEQGIITSDALVSNRAAIEQGYLDSVVDGVVAAVGVDTEKLQAFVRSVFPSTTNLPDVYRVLRTIPFSAALTTSFDSLLDETFDDKDPPAYTPNDAEAVTEALHKRSFFILKLYGDINRSETLSFSHAAFEDKLAENLPFQRFLETLSFSRTLLLVGASIDDLDTYLRDLGLRSRRNPRTHYALVGVSGDGWQAKVESLERRYAISVIPYDDRQEREQLTAFSTELASTTARSKTRPEQFVTRLNRIQLENIGPFADLDLEHLDPHWTILLGDNGVGKSNILRAIGLAICGGDGQKFAGRMLKGGTTKGSITLYTDRNVYLTNLLASTPPGQAEVSSVPGRALEAENWLAIGFPALRTMSWDRPRAPEAIAQGLPTPGDLLPLIEASVDPRPDRLKQWIVNLDYLVKDEQARGVAGGPYDKLLARFFDVVSKLLGEGSIKRGDVNPTTHEITIVTQDGRLPFEVISQGMTSLLGWVGILLQRLYEIYGADEDPTQRYALVLIDEIDAHLHPDWQRTLVDKLEAIFPNVQFIATTHSPLIVAGLPIQQVIRFIRDDDGKVVRMDIDQDMTMGRADQILRGALFGLPGTMAPRTVAKLDRYEELHANPKRSAEEEAEYSQLQQDLQLGLVLQTDNKAITQTQADLLKKLAQDIRDEDPESARVMLADAERLLAQVRGPEGDDPRSIQS